MNIIDIIIILILIAFVKAGFENGFLKVLFDTIILYIASILCSFASDVIFTYISKWLPFVNLFGKIEGLKSVNIIMWKLIIYVALISLFIRLIYVLLEKIGFSEKLADTIVTTNLIGRIVGAIIFPIFTLILLFNVILVLMFPGFNFKKLNDSKVAKLIVSNMPILSKQNSNLYQNESFIIDRINEDDNTISEYKTVNDEIIQNMIDTNFVTEELIETLSDDKLVGTRKMKSKKKTTTTTEAEEIDEDDEYYEDDTEEYYDDEDDDEYMSEDEDYGEYNEEDDFDDETFCEENPEYCEEDEE